MATDDQMKLARDVRDKGRAFNAACEEAAKAGLRIKINDLGFHTMGGGAAPALIFEITAPLPLDEDEQ